VTQDVFGMFKKSGIFTIKTVKQVDRLQLKQQDIYWEKKMKLSYRGISYDRNPSELVARRPFNLTTPILTKFLIFSLVSTKEGHKS
jgi:16S rRNA A1518/A1519 N6-dimethyltransferase RsmA/KsgA/DIM1 with predicted DNA glycosylase/AP lyase activity